MAGQERYLLRLDSLPEDTSKRVTAAVVSLDRLLIPEVGLAFLREMVAGMRALEGQGKPD